MLGADMTRTALSVRYACFYGAVFLALGVYLPFWPVWLAERGLDAADIGLLLALTSWIKVLSVPSVARLVDWSGRPKTALVFMSLLSLGGFALFLLAWDFWTILAVVTISSIASSLAASGMLKFAGADRFVKTSVTRVPWYRDDTTRIV